MTDVDGELLDDLQRALEAADEPMTSAELADELGIDDRAGTPKTREAVRVLVQERHVPVVASNNGYHIVQTRAGLDAYLDTLDARIRGIESRKQMVVQAFEGGQTTLVGGAE